ncbi:MAG: histidine kinase [Proteocatella sp.]
MKKSRYKYISYRVELLIIFMFIFSGLTILSGFALSEKSLKSIDLMVPLILIYISMGCMAYKFIYLPYKETNKILLLFSSGYTLEGIYNLKYHISPEIEFTIEKQKEYLNNKELITATKKQAQYLALQNQINPHFLYNTLEGIRSEAVVAGMDDIADMTEALATFFRYTISNVENLVTLEDELKNIENYYFIQQFRFGERINMDMEYDCESKEAIKGLHLPKLILQPIVENAIFHGIERKLGRGQIRIKLQHTASRLIITISDNGAGIEESRLKIINEKLSTCSLENENTEKTQKGGIAMTNVNNRIKLLFGEEYGIYIYSTLNAGTDVEITLPKILQNKS